MSCCGGGGTPPGRLPVQVSGCPDSLHRRRPHRRISVISDLGLLRCLASVFCALFPRPRSESGSTFPRFTRAVSAPECSLSGHSPTRSPAHDAYTNILTLIKSSCESNTFRLICNNNNNNNRKKSWVQNVQSLGSGCLTDLSRGGKFPTEPSTVTPFLSGSTWNHDVLERNGQLSHNHAEECDVWWHLLWC